MRKLLLGTFAVSVLSLAMGAFTADLASARTPHGFTEGNKTGWHRHHVPPGWHHGTKTGWGTSRTRPPGLR